MEKAEFVKKIGIFPIIKFILIIIEKYSCIFIKNMYNKFVVYIFTQKLCQILSFLTENRKMVLL